MVAQPATPSTPFLSRAEIGRLFTIIWQNGPDAQEARETIIQDNLKSVRNFILNYPATSWYDVEDAQQEAYLRLAVSIDKVPPHTEKPGARLYAIACWAVRNSCGTNAVRAHTSLDAILPGTERYTLYEMIAEPALIQTHQDSAPLYAALSRLPLSQQHALQTFFDLADFQPHPNSRRVTSLDHSQGGTRQVRWLAYRELRRDRDLQEAVFAQPSKKTQAHLHPLKQYRLLHGWSQHDVAERVGTRHDAVSRWETGKRQPDASHREQLCHLYGVSAEQLGLKNT